MHNPTAQCVLCTPQDVVLEHELAYVRHDDSALSPGHLIVVPKRHVASFFDMTAAEKLAVSELLDEAKQFIETKHQPDGYNIGTNIGEAGGQSRTHVPVHLTPRYRSDHPSPHDGVRGVLSGTCKA
ncbi:MAG: HIT family protein [Thiotrichales bacterium]